MGPIESRIAVCDLNEGGCFVRSARGSPAPGRSLVLKIILPGEGWICLKAEVLYVIPDSGFAVSFVDVPHRASDRLTRTLRRMRGELADTDKDRSLVLPSCPRCCATAVRPLGMARSTLPWFACQRCDAVWAATLTHRARSHRVPWAGSSRRCMLLATCDFCRAACYDLTFAPVAQLDRAPAF